MPVRPSANLALLSLLATPSLTTNPAHKRLSPPPPLLPPLPSTLSPPRSTPPQCTSCHPSARHAGAAQRQPCPAFAPFYAVARLGPTESKDSCPLITLPTALFVARRPHPPIHDVAEHSHCRTPTLPPVPFAPTHPFTAPLSSVSSPLTTWILPTICRRAPKLRTASVHHG